MDKGALNEIKLRFRVAVELCSDQYRDRTGQLTGYAQQAILLSWSDIPALIAGLKEERE